MEFEIKKITLVGSTPSKVQIYFYHNSFDTLNNVNHLKNANQNQQEPNSL